MRPTVSLLFSHPAHFISLGFGSGLAPKAPGTVGSFVAWGIWALVFAWLPWPSEWALTAFLVLAFLLGSVCIARTGAALGEVDHGGIVWDEFVAVWLVLACLPATFVWQLAGVLVFRVFDIAKPWPIRQADARFKNGLGVMFDDVLAAGYTLLILLPLRNWLA
ncbi:MAG: phosphatidylglycerophosphatase A [Candidatus Dactylopiibacterium carminicum]|uniref:Phosphatidylglycerophosphatase A n=1 Tax=Candidatus Dactylopiibacterium carminicum TaxID=857335 RepID=A0A272EYU1_9RHOO|nr:phosphatidylglycerophosphatase A [Candidatus Dactylopiibacterium carminicum]KAF7600798.1 phosphatidylglycerophosphatase A [Candidatus Dactylopiibacterium carminicum]PAS95297.1 MAG: phosphatidylglycerophosphatase A [Candidatus Dactylopiibacterium carminicum]PAS98691.1 MAG: phosphatidylglycerophosphatase A [Candidatus Dactylopiibacterium carminicum]PAT00805.1 MAG: phosphatidylglycerophosphatase A [Candidatus Dactylopiibacterium carminicum]